MIETRGLTKTYSTCGNNIAALEGVDFAVEEGDFIVVYGASGCGKTTLLLMLGGMLRPTSGTVTYRGQDIYALTASKRNGYRKHHIGFIFQKFFLLPYMTAFDNIRFASILGRAQGNREQRILDVATRLGMADRLTHFPFQLSVGEQQRIAVARAVIAEPEILLADEPTGNLDQSNSKAFADFLVDENRRGRTIVLVTHDESLLQLGNRTVRLQSGKLAPTHTAPSSSRPTGERPD
jgi:putative ABC transport system ATP-binding protein